MHISEIMSAELPGCLKQNRFTNIECENNAYVGNEADPATRPGCQ